MADEAVFEHDAIGGQLINRWRFDDRVAGASKRVISLVVGKKENDIGPLCFGGSSGGGCLGLTLRCRRLDRNEESQNERGAGK